MCAYVTYDMYAIYIYYADMSVTGSNPLGVMYKLGWLCHVFTTLESA